VAVGTLFGGRDRADREGVLSEISLFKRLCPARIPRVSPGLFAVLLEAIAALGFYFGTAPRFYRRDIENLPTNK
jgi:hypothetical protein